MSPNITRWSLLRLMVEVQMIDLLKSSISKILVLHMHALITKVFLCVSIDLNMNSIPLHNSSIHQPIAPGEPKFPSVCGGRGLWMKTSTIESAGSFVFF